MWVFLQYLLGFKKLGWDVLYLDAIDPATCVDETGKRCSIDRSLNLRYLLEVMRRFGLGDSFSLIYNQGERFVGRSREQVLEQIRNSALLLNVMGFITDEEILGDAPKKVFLDIDPGFGQMWKELGLADIFDGHDAFVTIGENIGEPACSIPTCGLSWIPSRHPIVLDYWSPSQRAVTRPFTTVASWRGAFAPVEFAGLTYGLRVHEFRKFLGLPRQTAHQFEIALDIDPAEEQDLQLLNENGWTLVEPASVAGDPWSYQHFIQESKAEFAVAKNMYVQSRSGWFSDRSICYLASGKPVLAQDTGLNHRLPVGEGLLTFRSLDEAVSGAEEICCDYERHARAARMLAEEYFDSDKVLRRLLSKLGVA